MANCLAPLRKSRHSHSGHSKWPNPPYPTEISTHTDIVDTRHKTESKNLLDSPELQAIRSLDGDVRRYLYDTCLPFEVGIHLLPLGLLETVDEKLHEFTEKRSVLVAVFLAAYPRLCQEAAGRLRTLHNPADYPPVEEVRSRFTFTLLMAARMDPLWRDELGQPRQGWMAASSGTTIRE